MNIQAASTEAPASEGSHSLQVKGHYFGTELAVDTRGMRKVTPGPSAWSNKVITEARGAPRLKVLY